MLIGLGMLVFFVLLAVIGPLVAPYDPSASLSSTNGVPQPPSAAHWLGTTQTQQDLLSQLLVGGRSTMLVAILAGLVATALSVIIGVTAGYVGGLVDDLLSMLINIGLVLPALPLLIVMTGFLPKDGNPSDLLIGLIIAVTGWAWGARVLRVQTLSLRNRDFVESARHHRRAPLADHRFRDPARPGPDHRLLVPVHRHLRRRHLHGAGVPRPDQRNALELGHDLVLGAEPDGRAERVLVVVGAARPRGSPARHLAGPAQLRDR